MKLRWHSLVTRYQRNRNFKYREHMLFLRDDQLLNTTKLQAADTLVSDWPEFIITEKDLVDNEPPEEYVFLEVDDDSNGNEKATATATTKLSNPKLVISEEKASNVPNVKPAMQVKQQSKNLKENSLLPEENKSLPSVSVAQHQQEEDKKTMTPLIRLQVFKDVKAVAESGKEVTIKATKGATCSSSESSSEKQAAALDKVTESKPKSPSSKSQDADKTKGQEEKNEDVIFGELIVAMLKRMDEDKKRSVKKEIMNLLLT